MNKPGEKERVRVTGPHLLPPLVASRSVPVVAGWREMWARGFTLIELVIIMGILSVAAVPILGMFIEAGKSTATNLDLQTAIQLAQECSELILAQKRLDIDIYPTYGYAGITDCSALAAKFPINGFTAPPTVTITDPFTDTGCPDATASCKLIQVAAIKNGSTLASISFMVADY